jgi:hypothetical protein
MKILIFVIILGLFSGCNKPDPNPELHDEIYTDLLQELDIATKGLEAEEKNLTKLEEERDKAVPQTGQIKFAQKKVYETEATITKLRQQKQFFEIKIELRKAEARARYLEARKGGRKWPDPEEIANYKEAMKLQREKLTWDKNKGHKKDVPRGTSGGEHGEAPPPAEHH